MRRAAVIVVCAAATLATWSAGARAATATQTIALLNAQRAMNGLPAGIVEDPTLSADCAAHDHYMALNNQLTHFEQPHDRGYTTGGAYAGRNAVLSRGATWNDGNPYEYAPLHLDQLLAPRLQTVGSADAEGFSCTTTFPGWTRPDPAAPTVYTYPGNGSTTIYPAETAREQPWTPGQLVGLSATARTGPYLIVFVDAPGQSPYDTPATLTGASLTGPSGPVSVKTVDGNTAVSGGTLAPYLYPGGFIVPVSPLAAGTAYHAHVVVGFGGIQTAHDWSFTTAGSDPQSSLTARHGTLRFASRSPQAVQVSFTRAGGAHAPGITLRPGASTRLRLAAGSWQACGRQAATGTFSAFDGCITIIVTGVPKLHLGAGRLRGSRVVFSLSYSSVLRGRSAALTTTPLTVRCAGRACSTTAGRPSTRTITLVGTQLSFPLAQRGHGLRIKLSTGAFQLRDAPWTSARATASFIG